MRDWRSRLIGVLFVYFCGFATAIYALVPGSQDLAEEQGLATEPKESAVSILKSDDFAHQFRAGMDKCVSFGRTASIKAAELLRKKYTIGSRTSDNTAK